MSGPIAVPVAIVGGGPVGMILALYLARLGVGSVLIEQDEATLWHPKGNTHNARTMELYRLIGLADKLRVLGLPPDYPTDVAYMTRMNGIEIYRHVMQTSEAKLAARDRHEPLDQIPEPLHRVNQMYVERAVSDHLRANALIDARYGWRLAHFAETADGVLLDIVHVHSGEKAQLPALYMVGCDGPRSAVREQLGFRYVGEDRLDKSFMGGPMLATYVKIRSRDNRPVRATKAWQYWMLMEGKIVNLVTLDGNDDYIFTAPQLDTSDPTIVAEAVRECVGGDVDVEVISSREWTAGRALVAEHYRRGRVFLCGDATHLFTPTGGFGMNTGVDDAVNLAWKLAATVEGWGGAALLDSFEAERRPIGVRNSTMARGHASNINQIRLSSTLVAATPEGDAARAETAEILASLKEEFGSIGIQLGARYDGSQLIVSEPDIIPPADDPFVYTATSLPGGRAPHLWLPDGTSLYDKIGAGFTLLVFDRAADPSRLEQAAIRRKVPLKVLEIDMPEAAALYPHRMALIRPDLYVAWRDDAIVDPDALLDRVTGAGG